MEENISPENRIFEVLKRNTLIVVLIGVGSVLSAIGLIQYFTSNSDRGVEFVAGAESKSQQVAGEVTTTQITVDVEGEVKIPGVYRLSKEARIKDALDAAGGLSSNADKEYISKKLNLAQKVTDGGKIYIPATGEGAPVKTGQTTDAFVSALVSEPQNSLIDINSASESQLDTLPKVGPVTAQKIIGNRPYASIEDLVSKKIVTQKTLDQIKDRITVQ